MKLLSKKEALQEIARVRQEDSYITNEWLSKNYIYLLTNSGDLIEIDKPKIDNVIYYDDEKPTPDTGFESWKEYNLFYNFRRKSTNVDEWLEDIAAFNRTGCCSARLLQRPAYFKHKSSFCYEISLYCDVDIQERYKDVMVSLDDVETLQFITCMQTLKDDYIKRLQTYYKRYSHKIYTYGYWANR